MDEIEDINAPLKRENSDESKQYKTKYLKNNW
jgi:hypothetical protein